MDESKVAENSLAVKICNETVRVTSEEGPDYILRMANYINYIVDEFNEKKGKGVPQTLLLVYAALELCNSLFGERDNKMSAKERNYEKMFHMEVFNHKKTQDSLAAAEKRLDEAERRLNILTKELESITAAAENANGDKKGPAIDVEVK
ncbi:MAG: cell division protein ZapA [Clostridiales bacterium]|jgi:hypothetical protein|nr:cell division protein ZapA [Clostridiales bacterium]